MRAAPKLVIQTSVILAMNATHAFSELEEIECAIVSNYFLITR